MKATHDYEDFKQNEIIKIDNMIEPTLVNVGTNDAFINGIVVKSGDSYVVGSASVIIINTSINLTFPTAENVAQNQINKVRLFANIPITQNADIEQCD